MPRTLQSTRPPTPPPPPTCAFVPPSDQRTVFHATKRLLDVVIAVCALVLTGPLILFCALLVKLTSRGPACYRASVLVWAVGRFSC